MFFCGSSHFADGIQRAEGVGNPGEGEDFCLCGKESSEGGLVENTVFIAGNHNHFRTGSFREHLPGDDVRVVFKGRNEYLIACGKREDVGDEVDAIGSAGSEDDLIGRVRVDVGGDGFAGCLVGGGGGTGEEMGAAVNVRVHRLIVMPRGIQHRAGFLRGRRVVKIDERTTVDGFPEDGEVGFQGSGEHVG